ncbi:MAG: SDR family oxidoreductase [Pseudomonadota bacterium]
MRVIVTGAHGLIGQAIASKLRPTAEVISLGRRAGADITVDLRSIREPSDISLPRCDALVHCAGVTDEEVKQNAGQALDRAALGTKALLSAALAAGAQRAVYISSAHVYGPLEGEMDETCAARPTSDYGRAHLAAEQVFKRAAQSSDLSCLVLRPCAVFGALKTPTSFSRWGLIPFGFPRAAMRDRCIKLRSAGTQQRNFVGTQDIATLVERWLWRPSPAWSVINPVGRVDLSVYEFARLCGALSDTMAQGNCRVLRPDDGSSQTGEGSASFRYRSATLAPVGAQRLSQTLRGLMQQIHAP